MKKRRRSGAWPGERRAAGHRPDLPADHRENVFTFINISLFGLGVALVLLGPWLDAIVSTGMVFLNVVVSVGQEGRAKHKLDQIALLTRPRRRSCATGRSVDPPERSCWATCSK